MPTQTSDTLIIGGGLSGLYAAYLLTQKNLPFVILEARDLMGGRILTAEHLGFFPDLGPSWYWPEINPKLMHLIQTLGLRGYQQFEQGMGRFETAHAQNGNMDGGSGKILCPLSRALLTAEKLFWSGLQPAGPSWRNP